VADNDPRPEGAAAARTRDRLVHAVTSGGLPANAAAAVAANPLAAAAAAANPGVPQGILDAATSSFGHGLHVALTVAASIMLAGSIASLAAVRGRASSEPPMTDRGRVTGP